MPSRFIAAPPGVARVVAVAPGPAAATWVASCSGCSFTLNVLRTPPLRATSTLTIVARLAEADHLLQLAHVLDRLAVHRDDDVARLDAGGLGRRVVAGNVLDHHAADLGQADVLRRR